MTKELRNQTIIKMYAEENQSVNQIAKTLQLSWGTVDKVLKENNVKTKACVNQYGYGNQVNEDLFSYVNNEDTAYWLGFLYADGAIRSKRNEIAFELKGEDYQSVEDFHTFSGNKNSIRKHIVKKGDKEYLNYVSSFSNQKVKENLIKLGCTPKKSLTLTFPNEQQVPFEFLKHFIRGYVDGDGYIQFDAVKHKYRVIICGTKNFLNGLVNRCDNIESYSVTKDNSSNIYILTISVKQNVYNFLDWIYSDSHQHLERKYKKYIEAKQIMGA